MESLNDAAAIYIFNRKVKACTIISFTRVSPVCDNDPRQALLQALKSGTVCCRAHWVVAMATLEKYNSGEDMMTEPNQAMIDRMQEVMAQKAEVR